jgi:hypothetical protein
MTDRRATPQTFVPIPKTDDLTRVMSLLNSLLTLSIHIRNTNIDEKYFPPVNVLNENITTTINKIYSFLTTAENVPTELVHAFTQSFGKYNEDCLRLRSQFKSRRLHLHPEYQAEHLQQIEQTHPQRRDIHSLIYVDSSLNPYTSSLESFILPPNITSIKNPQHLQQPQQYPEQQSQPHAQQIKYPQQQSQQQPQQQPHLQQTHTRAQQIGYPQQQPQQRPHLQQTHTQQIRPYVQQPQTRAQQIGYSQHSQHPQHPQSQQQREFFHTLNEINSLTIDGKEVCELATRFITTLTQCS